MELDFTKEKEKYFFTTTWKVLKNMTVATKIANQTGGGILVVTEGVFGMSGDQGKLKEIIEYRKSGKFNFRIFVDDAHGIWNPWRKRTRCR